MEGYKERASGKRVDDQTAGEEYRKNGKTEWNLEVGALNEGMDKRGRKIGKTWGNSI